MIHRGKIIEVYGLWFVDLICIWSAFLLATFLRYANFRDMDDMSIHYQVGVLFLVFCTVYNFILDWNHDFLRRRVWREVAAIFQYMVFMLLVVGSIILFLKWAEVFSRLILIYFTLICFVLTLFAHLLIKRILRAYYSSDKSATKLLVIAEAANLPATLARLGGELSTYYQIMGAASLDIDQTGQYVCGIPVVAGIQNLHEMCTKMALDEVFIDAPTMAQEKIHPLVCGFEDMGIDCHYSLLFNDRGLHSRHIEAFGGFTVVTYAPVVTSFKRLLIKRLMDICGGLVGLSITLILFPFVALAIRLESPGPTFFAQTRIGKNGRRFTIYKFRSMYRDAEQRQAEFESRNEMKGPMFKIKDDPRITRVGRFIRRTSIDELPQFFNILRGNMSLVGTRPPTVEEFSRYNQHYRRRLCMTPGLTGLWQISGRSDVADFDDVLRLDLQYIDEWSLWLDMWILAKTVVVVLGRRGAR